MQTQPNLPIRRGETGLILLAIAREKIGRDQKCKLEMKHSGSLRPQWKRFGLPISLIVHVEICTSKRCAFLAYLPIHPPDQSPGCTDCATGRKPTPTNRKAKVNRNKWQKEHSVMKLLSFPNISLVQVGPEPHVLLRSAD